ncbi:translation initiation factor IF-2-like [Passer montanus]|uniref:translation initiation factor IF-2-like n=1 Tax=Passer montanus TaxID=9160 RepID=UPI001960C265|nr:translation initiation factor IF-2-like [Passer montanus]
MQRFVFKPQGKQAGAGEGKGKRHPPRERKRRGTKTTGSAVSRPFGHSKKCPPEPPRRLPAGRQWEAACPVRRHPERGTPAALRPGAGGQRRPPSAAGSAGRRAGGGASASTSASSAAAARAPRPGRAASPPRCPDPRWSSGGFGKGLPSLRVSTRTPPPERFPHSLRSSRRWPRRRPSQGQAVSRAIGGRQSPVAHPRRAGSPGRSGGSARAPRFRRTGSGREAQAGNNATAAFAACSCLGAYPSSPGNTQPKSGEGKTAGNITWTEAESPAGRG